MEVGMTGTKRTSPQVIRDGIGDHELQAAAASNDRRH